MLPNKKLTQQIIESSSDEELLDLVIDDLAHRRPVNSEEVYPAVISWNEARRVFYIIWLLDAEVNNGGFNQFYYNPGGRFYQYLPEALKRIGADGFAELMNRANETFEKDYIKISQDQDGTLEGFSNSYEDNPLNAYYNEYYDLSVGTDLLQLLVDYVRTHPAEFVDKK